MQQNPEIYVVIIIGIILGLLLVGFIVTILFLYQRRQKKQELEIVSMKDKYEKEALRSQLEIQENTFKTIGQELHDNIGQMLSVVKLSLSALPIDKEHQANEMIKGSQEVLNKAIIDLSQLTKSLHTERIVDVGLPESIREELMSIKKAGLIKVYFHVIGDEVSFDEQKSIFLFRIFQEALNNILKHANASSVSITLSYLSDSFMMEIKDDGKGFDLKAKRGTEAASSGVGLRSLYNRASIINADISIQSLPGQGTTVLIKLSLPIEN